MYSENHSLITFKHFSFGQNHRITCVCLNVPMRQQILPPIRPRQSIHQSSAMDPLQSQKPHEELHQILYWTFGWIHHCKGLSHLTAGQKSPPHLILIHSFILDSINSINEYLQDQFAEEKLLMDQRLFLTLPPLLDSLHYPPMLLSHNFIQTLGQKSESLLHHWNCFPQ